jgi:hypothetical protein
MLKEICKITKYPIIAILFLIIVSSTSIPFLYKNNNKSVYGQQLKKFKETDCAFYSDCCNNNIDDEIDGYKDMKDQDCNGQFNKGKEVCNDAADNDEDGYADLQDSDCNPPFAKSPSQTPQQQQPSASDLPPKVKDKSITIQGPLKKLDTSKLKVIETEKICNDGIDNDGDGLIDNSDIDCNTIR